MIDPKDAETICGVSPTALDCGCLWCGLNRMFSLLATAGIHSQKDLDERMREIAETGGSDAN